MPTGIEVCGSCGANFDTREAIINLGEAKSLVGFFLGLPAIPPWVACPRCGTEFRASAMMYFGFIPPESLRRILLGFAAVMVLAGLLFVILPDMIR